MSRSAIELQMKVLHIVSSMEPGGIEHLVFSIMCADVKNVYILAIGCSREESFIKWPALEAYSANFIFANKKKGFCFGVTQLIKQTCKEHTISVIHSHHIGPLIYGSLASLSMKSLKHVHTQHDIWHLKDRKQWLIEYLILSSRKNIHLVAVSTNIFNKLNSLYPRHKISLVYNGIDINRFKPGNKHDIRTQLKLPLNSTIIACVGRLEEVKGQRYLIQAMAYLPKSYYLAIAGKGSLSDALRKETETLGLLSRVCFLDQVDQIELLYQASDLLCLPSLDEGLPLAILESQACNVPVVCSNVGSCTEGVDPESGLLIPPKNPKAIAQACLELLNSNKQPREFILSQFSLSSLIEKYQQIYALPHTL